MSNQLPNEIEAFQVFLTQTDAGSPRTLDEAVRQFRDCQLRDKLKPAIEESHRGESQVIDFDEVKRRCRERLAEEGITE